MRMELTNFADTSQDHQGSVWQKLSFFVKTRNLVENSLVLILVENSLALSFWYHIDLIQAQI